MSYPMFITWAFLWAFLLATAIILGRRQYSRGYRDGCDVSRAEFASILSRKNQEILELRHGWESDTARVVKAKTARHEYFPPKAVPEPDHLKYRGESNALIVGAVAGAAMAMSSDSSSSDSSSSSSSSDSGGCGGGE